VNLERFNAEDTTGIFAGFALIKEIGPVITALLFAGRAGTALASEIGLMKATDQLSAMEMMAVDPLRYVVIPRFLGGVIAMPLLTAVFTTIGLAGAHVVAVEWLGVDVGAYWQQLQQALDMEDVLEGIYKSRFHDYCCRIFEVTLCNRRVRWNLAPVCSSYWVSAHCFF